MLINVFLESPNTYKRFPILNLSIKTHIKYHVLLTLIKRLKKKALDCADSMEKFIVMVE